MRTFLYKTSDPSSHKLLGEKFKELPEGEYVVSVKKNRAIRSLSANRYYFAILNIIAIHTGHDSTFLHEEMKRKFNSESVLFPKSGMVIKPKSTSTLDSGEFSAYVNRVKQWAMDEFSIIIPEVDDFNTQNLMDLENQYSKSFSGY